MELELFANQMASQAGIIHSLTLGITDEQTRWKPDPHSWSILEVINHLYDEECADFRLRLDTMPDVADKDYIKFTARTKWCLPDAVEPYLYDIGFSIIVIMRPVSDFNSWESLRERVVLPVPTSPRTRLKPRRNSTAIRRR